MTEKAIWRGGGQIPTNGSEGVAWAAYGFDDPESPEHGAFCFQPATAEEGEEGVAYYCDPAADLEFLS